jgi:hypothetical protein
LRKLNVNGLVFPSARSDSQVIAQDRTAVEWAGFNFVDYRNTRRPKHVAAMDLSVGWPTKIESWPDDWTEGSETIVYDTASISSKDSGIDSGSWNVGGIEMRRAAPYSFCELAWLLEQIFGDNDPHAKNVLGLAYDFVQKMNRPDLPRDLVNALMGVPGSRERILKFVMGPALDRDPHIRASVQFVLTHVAG